VIRRAQDGLPARVSGRWTQDKLEYVKKYAAAFMKAMAPKRTAESGPNSSTLICSPDPGKGLIVTPALNLMPPAKLSAGRRLSPEEALSLDRPWVLAFRSKMAKIGFRYQDEGDPCFTNEKNVPMYHLLFFSKDVVGLTIWRGIKKIDPSGQRTLPL